MEQNKNDTQKKTQMPERKREDISQGPRTTNRPEIDLPLKGGRAESDLSSKNQPRRDTDFEKSSR